MVQSTRIFFLAALHDIGDFEYIHRSKVTKQLFNWKGLVKKKLIIWKIEKIIDCFVKGGGFIEQE